MIQVSHHDSNWNSPSNLSQHSSRIACPRLKYSRRVKIEKTDKYTQVNQYLLKELIGRVSYLLFLIIFYVIIECRVTHIEKRLFIFSYKRDRMEWSNWLITNLTIYTM